MPGAGRHQQCTREHAGGLYRAGESSAPRGTLSTFRRQSSAAFADLRGSGQVDSWIEAAPWAFRGQRALLQDCQGTGEHDNWQAGSCMVATRHDLPPALAVQGFFSPVVLQEEVLATPVALHLFEYTARWGGRGLALPGSWRTMNHSQAVLRGELRGCVEPSHAVASPPACRYKKHAGIENYPPMQMIFATKVRGASVHAPPAWSAPPALQMLRPAPPSFTTSGCCAHGRCWSPSLKEWAQGHAPNVPCCRSRTRASWTRTAGSSTAWPTCSSPSTASSLTQVGGRGGGGLAAAGPGCRVG